MSYFSIDCATPEELTEIGRAMLFYGSCQASGLTTNDDLRFARDNSANVTHDALAEYYALVFDRLQHLEKRAQQPSGLPCMYMVCGCSGSGKTTFAKKFAAANNLLYLGADDFYAKVNGSELKRGNKFEVWQELFKAIHDAEVNGVSCLVDSNSLSAASRDEMVNWFPGFDHHLIYIEADEQLRMENNRKRVRQIPDEVMIAMRTKVEPPVWNTLDKRWLSLTRILNDNREYRIIQAEGSHKIVPPT
ncbi:MAG: ATP-binding protein [Bacteroidaceae bacterium]|nr:ATP-binding protein [Bacteroidaceae bacterium]